MSIWFIIKIIVIYDMFFKIFACVANTKEKLIVNVVDYRFCEQKILWQIGK